MEIQTQQIKQLQTICSGKFSDREERLNTLSDLVGFEIQSVKDLNSVQADDLIHFFNTGKEPDNSSWGRFDNHNSKHKAVLSRCHTLGWIDEETGFVDLHRLGGWLKSNRSPVPKPLREMESFEISKIIKALDNMIGDKYK